MRRVDLSNFNPNLLLALDGLLSHRSVTAAAKRVRVTPSAMSHSLSELRHLLGDPLLVRSGRGMVLTPRAAVYQYQFTPIDAYNPALLNAFGAPTPGPANVRVFDVVQPSFGAASIDFYVTPPAGVEAKWFTNLPFGSGTAFHAAGAGAHSFRVTPYNTQTLLAQKSAVVLSTGASLDAFLFPTSATTFGLLRCPST